MCIYTTNQKNPCMLKYNLLLKYNTNLYNTVLFENTEIILVFIELINIIEPTF